MWTHTSRALVKSGRQANARHFRIVPQQQALNAASATDVLFNFRAPRMDDFHNCQQIRSFRGGYKKKRNKKKEEPKQEQKPPTPGNKPNVQARPTGEKEFQSKFALPDKDKEQEISRIQVQVQELHRAGNYSKALEAAEELLEESEKHFGKGIPHPATAAAHNNAGLMLKLLGRFDESRKQYQSALKIYKAIVGTDHASYASILHNLGNLNRSQVHLDDTLRATDRLSLIETAAEYLEQAYNIRNDELGHDHPHTVASRSSWGATLATQILHHYKMTTKQQEKTGDLAKKRFYVSLLPNEITASAWSAAEDHLRQALQTAIDNPRGPSIQKSTAKRGKQTPKKSAEPETKSLQTLSATASAQNLAIFLKCHATTITDQDGQERQDAKKAWLEEAHSLYQQVLYVQAQLLPEKHPDRYATQYSLAELLDTMGDEEGANAIRQEIVDTYDPPKDEDTVQVESKTSKTS